MKNLVLLLFITSLFTSCETIEFNTPGFQANLEGTFYKANETKAIKRSVSSYTIQGITEDEIITLRVSQSNEGTYTLGGNSDNYAIFEDSNGNQYSTIPEGSGEVVITRKHTGQRYFNGSFSFTAISQARDTLVINRGVFFQVPYDEDINDEEDIPNTTELFIANIDNEEFNPFTIDISENSTSIVINAFTGSKTIRLAVPNDVVEGFYSLSNAGFNALITKNGITQEGTSGTIDILENDTSNRILNGRFSFVSDNFEVTEGRFNIVYF